MESVVGFVAMKTKVGVRESAREGGAVLGIIGRGRWERDREGVRRSKRRCGRA